jgi:hypothetical protein
MARNLYNSRIPSQDVTIQLTEACGLHIGDDMSDGVAVQAVDHAGVCQVTSGTVAQIQQVGKTIYIWVVNKFLTGNVQVERCKRYMIAGSLFDSLYPSSTEQEPVLVSNAEVNQALAEMGRNIDRELHQPRRAASAPRAPKPVLEPVLV